MTLIEELKEKFPVQDVPLHGKCIVIQAPNFLPSWEADLKQQGSKIFSGAEKGRAVFYVTLPKDATEKEREWLKGPNWAEKEDQILVARVKEKLAAGKHVDFEEIAKDLPGRSGNGVKMRISRLQKKGLLPEIPRRTYRRRERPESPSVSPINDNQLSELWSALTNESRKHDAALEQAYAIYGKMLVTNAAKDKIAEQKEHTLYLKGIAEGWAEASNLLNKLISEVLKEKPSEKTATKQ